MSRAATPPAAATWAAKAATRVRAPLRRAPASAAPMLRTMSRVATPPAATADSLATAAPEAMPSRVTRRVATVATPTLAQKATSADAHHQRVLRVDLAARPTPASLAP